MEDEMIARRIAGLLSEAWTFHQTPGFVEYARRTFGCKALQPVKCDAIYIAQMENGDAAAGSIGGMVQQWWRVDDQGMTTIPFAPLPSARDAPENLRGRFYPTPVLKFLRQGDVVALGEAFGPEMRCRKVGKIVIADDVLTFESLRLTWSNGTIQAADLP